MKKILLTLGALFTSCEEEVITYDGNFVAFADASTDSYKLAERSGTKTLTVGIASPQASDITINVTTTDDTAIEGTDYTVPSTVTILAGETFAELDLEIIDNSEVDSSKEFTLTLSSVENSSIPVGFADEGSYSKVITINNDDYDCDSEFEYWIGALTIDTDGVTSTGTGSANDADECNILVVDNDLPLYAETGYAGDSYTTSYELQFIADSEDGTEGYIIVDDTLIEAEFASYSDGTVLDAHFTADGTFNTNTGIIELTYSVDLYSGSENLGSWYSGTTTIEYAN